MKYIQTENFNVTHAEREAFTVEGFLGNIFVIEDNAASAEWINRHNYTTRTKAEAEAKLNELQPSAAPKKEEVPKKEVPKKEVKAKVPFRVQLELLTKAELEKEMRKHGLELDRRKTKDALVKQSVAFLKGK